MAVSHTDALVEYSHRAFRGTPDVHQYVPLDSVEQEVRGVLDAVIRGDGIAVLTAGPGAGKTVVCRHLQAELSGRFEAVMLSSSEFATRRSLLQAILFELGEPYEGLTEQELRLTVLNHARHGSSQRRGIVLIVDEAHLLNPRLLEELRCLTNHAQDGESLIRVVLCAQLALEELLTTPALQALNYRITCHATIEPLSVKESAELVAGRLRHVGRLVDTVFTPEALETICRVSDGNPRCLVQLCDHTLSIASSGEEGPVPVDVVRLALRDLKQLPLQWNESAIDQLDSAGASMDLEHRPFAAPEEERSMERSPESDDNALARLEELPSFEAPDNESKPHAISEWTSDVPSLEVGAEVDVVAGGGKDNSMAGWTAFETQTAHQPRPTDEPGADRPCVTGTESAMSNKKTPAAPCPSETPEETFVEVPVDDRYASLDEESGRPVEQPHMSQAVRATAGPSATHAIEEEAAAGRSPSDRTATLSAIADRLDISEAAVPDPVEFPDEPAIDPRTVSAPQGYESRRRSRDDVLVEVVSAQFDIVEPQWHEEPVIDDVPARPTQPAIEFAEGAEAVAACESQSTCLPPPRPYARLFSRLRREQS